MLPATLPEDAFTPDSMSDHVVFSDDQVGSSITPLPVAPSTTESATEAWVASMSNTLSPSRATSAAFPEDPTSPIDHGHEASGSRRRLVIASHPRVHAGEGRPRRSRETNKSESMSSNEDIDAIIDANIDAKLSADPSDPDVCTPDEAYMLRQLLRTVGPTEFCIRTVDSGCYTPKKLLTAFGIQAPDFLNNPTAHETGVDHEAYASLLTLAFSRELAKRAKLMAHNSVEDVVSLLRRSQNIMVITGAGISTSIGIPDFRSKGSGLYAMLEEMDLGVDDPQEVFDINLFEEDPSIFFTAAKSILIKTKRHTPTHEFIAMLDRMGKLLTNYTQNIDNLERHAGISPDRLIQCHGSFVTATCVDCHYTCPGEDITQTILEAFIPRCPKCRDRAVGAQTRKRAAKRARIRARFNRARAQGPADPNADWGSDGSDDNYWGGPGAEKIRRDKREDRWWSTPCEAVMKPDITFFGQDLPDAFGDRLVKHDRDKVDLVLVIGTSLKVKPVSEIISFLPPHVPQICISRDPIHHMNFDVDLLGECDVVVSELCRRLGWPLDHEMVPQGQAVDVTTQPEIMSRHSFIQVAP